MSEIATGVNTIRSLRPQLREWADRLGDDAPADLSSTIGELRERLDAVEAELVQVEFTSDGDELGYRAQLFEKLDALVPIVNSADARPTTQSYAVYEKLAALADAQLSTLSTLVADDLARVNAALAELGVDIIAAR